MMHFVKSLGKGLYGSFNLIRFSKPHGLLPCCGKLTFRFNVSAQRMSMKPWGHLCRGFHSYDPFKDLSLSKMNPPYTTLSEIINQLTAPSSLSALSRFTFQHHGDSDQQEEKADGVFYAELNEVLTRELAEDGYSGVEVRVTPMRTEIIIRATRTQNVLGEKGRRIRELTSLVQKRFRFPQDSVELYAEKVANRGLCAIAQAESLRYKLLGGLAVRR
ncbi:hypothetical protein F2Q68_00027785 [Brassica cretica]|uniref:KH type-2 domain-containing protein n=1 Tax=Brassica cretica TaxID=69181 RepID=A0A8S9IB51_BRACR|nr:hypothetical protein F2Q68_00027785 [Brassica cretica]